MCLLPCMLYPTPVYNDARAGCMYRRVVSVQGDVWQCGWGSARPCRLRLHSGAAGDAAGAGVAADAVLSSTTTTTGTVGAIGAAAPLSSWHLYRRRAHSAAVLQVSACEGQSCAVDVDGGMWTWRVESPTPARVAGLHGKHVRRCAAGADHLVAVTAAGDVYTWGTSVAGGLGLGRGVTVAEVPRPLQHLKGCVTAVAAGTHTIVVVDMVEPPAPALHPIGATRPESAAADAGDAAPELCGPPSLKALSQVALSRLVDVDNVGAMLHRADALAADGLRTFCSRFVVDNLDTFLGTFVCGRRAWCSNDVGDRALRDIACGGVGVLQCADVDEPDGDGWDVPHHADCSLLVEGVDVAAPPPSALSLRCPHTVPSAVSAAVRRIADGVLSGGVEPPLADVSTVVRRARSLHKKLVQVLCCGVVWCDALVPV